jgi:heme/copper-type cytochrome/quinol oxidase subunit 3
MEDADREQIQSDVKAAVAEAVAGWQQPVGKDLGRIWIISVSALAVATVLVVLAVIAFTWNEKDTTNVMALATLLLGAFIGWLGGSKANPAP